MAVRRRRLTDANVARLAPAAREYTVWDIRVPGLGVRVRPSGHRGYVYQCKVDGRAKRVTLGPAALKTVAEVPGRAGNAWRSRSRRNPATGP